MFNCIPEYNERGIERCRVFVTYKLKKGRDTSLFLYYQNILVPLDAALISITPVAG